MTAIMGGFLLLVASCNLYSSVESSYYIKNQPIIISGNFDYAIGALVLDIRYSGGCGRHLFSLEYQNIIVEDKITNYIFKLFDETDDFCELLVARTTIFPISGIKELAGVQKGMTRFTVLGGNNNYGPEGVVTSTIIDY